MAHHKRRVERGAVFVEALIVLCMTMVLYACGIFLDNAYTSKLNSFDEATSKAFALAVVGCGPAFGDAISMNVLVNSPPPDPTSTSPSAAGLGDIPTAPKQAITFT